HRHAYNRVPRHTSGTSPQWGIGRARLRINFLRQSTAGPPDQRRIAALRCCHDHQREAEGGSRMTAEPRADAAAPVRLILVDDHEMVIEGLKAMLAAFSDRVRVVGQAVGAERALSVVDALDPDIVLC